MGATLYRCTTPTDRLCACGLAARELRRQGIPFDQVRVSFRRSSRPEIEAISGQQRVPLLLLGGEVICDSRRIVEHLQWRSAHGR